MGKGPLWITKEEQCLWCWKMMPLAKIKVVDDNAVHMRYDCVNPECDCQRIMNFASSFTIIQNGEKAVESFLKSERETE